MGSPVHVTFSSKMTNSSTPLLHAVDEGTRNTQWISSHRHIQDGQCRVYMCVHIHKPSPVHLTEVIHRVWSLTYCCFDWDL